MILDPTTIMTCGVEVEMSTTAPHTLRGTWLHMSMSFIYAFIDFTTNFVRGWVDLRRWWTYSVEIMLGSMQGGEFYHIDI